MGRTSQAKERLLGVAFELIWGQSYAAVSVDQICEQADVKKGSFYHFFPSKSDLAVAAYEQYWQECRPEYDQIFSPQVPPLERIETYCEKICQSQGEKLRETGQVLGCPFASLGSELSTQDEKLRQKSAEIFGRMNRYLESALRDAYREGLVAQCDFKSLAESINGYVMGMLMQARVLNSVESLCSMYGIIRQMIGAETTPHRN